MIIHATVVIHVNGKKKHNCYFLMEMLGFEFELPSMILGTMSPERLRKIVAGVGVGHRPPVVSVEVDFLFVAGR